MMSGNNEDAQRIAHTLKGVSATLGIEQVRAYALSVEVDIHESCSEAQLSADIDVLRQKVTVAESVIREVLRVG